MFLKAGIPVIGASCTNHRLQKETHYFRVCYLDHSETVLANFAVDEFKERKHTYCETW